MRFLAGFPLLVICAYLTFDRWATIVYFAAPLFFPPYKILVEIISQARALLFAAAISLFYASSHQHLFLSKMCLLSAFSPQQPRPFFLARSENGLSSFIFFFLVFRFDILTYSVSSCAHYEDSPAGKCENCERSQGMHARMCQRIHLIYHQ